MKKNKNGNSIFVYIILLIIFIFLSIIIYSIVEENKNKTNSSIKDIEDVELNDDIRESVKPFDEDQYMKIVINDIEYEIKLENNISAFDLASVLPLELEMNDLNNNEKYSYLSFSLTNDDEYTGSIKKGDVMLYQTNCIVIFYKDFDTTYTYTKLGHIDNLPDLGNGSIKVIFK